jgi:ATP-dependent RNA helicase DeaD
LKEHPSDASTTFRDLLKSDALIAALNAVGYESPSPIQAATIPVLLQGRDLVGQAQTGTGKTAAFALPILAQIDLEQREPQALVLAPTRELAIQVAEAFQRYASHLQGFHVVPIYGGQSYSPQLHALRRGAHVVVGTPGRVMDHIKRETLRLSAIKHFVLDEADEMLRMGFIDDVEWILEQAPEQRQVALFSATMPTAIRRIAQRYLRDPAEVTIQTKTKTAEGIRQRYWLLSGMHKLDALTRILEVEPFDAMLVFARTKVATEELAERLEARGFAAEALNGDIAQAQRERTVGRLKNGQIDIVVATDVAARGLDVERVSHVVNYDVPYDPESYVHRIGRTGRAGRSGEAILFIAPRERNMLRVIERATRKPIERMELPTVADVNEQRIARFQARIGEALASGAADPFKALIENYEREHNIAAIDIAAALASLVQGKKPLLLEEAAASAPREDRHPKSGSDGDRERRESRPESRREFRSEKRDSEPTRQRDTESQGSRRKRDVREEAPREHARVKSRDPNAERLPKRERPQRQEEGMETFRVEVGHSHGITARNIVGAIANEAGLDGRHIGRVVIEDDHSFVDLPEGMPKDVFRELQKVRVGGQKLQISRALKTQTERLSRGAERTFEGRNNAKSTKKPRDHKK